MDLLTYVCFSDPLDENCPASHFEVPSHNLISVGAFSKVFKDSESDCSSKLLPSIPVYQPFPYTTQSSVLFCGSCPKDHALELVENKLNWETKLEKLRVPSIDAVIKNIKKTRQNKEKLSKDSKKYIEHVHCDPEPMFSGSYNWLYTGGCLSYDVVCDETYVITSDRCEDKPSLNILQLNKTQDEILLSSSFQLKSYSPVFQITCRPHLENLIICVRQKDHLSLFKTDRRNPLCLPVKLLKKKISGSKLFTCADLETNCEKLIVTDSNHEINVFNVEKENKIYGYCGRKIAPDFTGNNWNQIEFGELGIYWALRNHFAIFDIRDFNCGTKLNFKLPSEMDTCENISSFTKSQTDSNFVYLSTTHRILQVDLRNTKIVQTWTHLLKHPPQFTATVKNKERSEFLLLQSSSVDEILGIINEHVINDDNVYSFSKSLPYLLNSIKDSVSFARDRNTCLNFLVPGKVDFSVTGMQCFKNNQSDISLYITNSGGDIFLTKLKNKIQEPFPTDDENNQRIIKGLEMYESTLKKFRLKQSLKKLDKFEFVNMSRLLQDFQDSELTTETNEKHKSYWKYQDMDVSRIFELFQDISNLGCLDIWFPPDLNVRELDTEAEMVNLEAKVLDWLGKL